MMGHEICLFGEIWKIISKLYLLLLLIWSSVKYQTILDFLGKTILAHYTRPTHIAVVILKG